VAPVFNVGDRVRLTVGADLRAQEALGTVIGFQEDDIVVRWDVGVERPLSPASLAPAGPSSVESPGPDAPAYSTVDS
jgi:hypothetical protein